MEGVSAEGRRALLFDAARLEERFKYFEALCLPSIAAQTDPDWHAVILYSPELPEPWRARLLDQLAPYSHVRAVPVPPELRLLKALRGQLEEIVPNPRQPCLTFRLDDDDGLSNRYVARLRNLASRYPVNLTAFTFPAEYLLSADEAGGAVQNGREPSRVRNRPWFGVVGRGSGPQERTLSRDASPKD